MPIPLDTSKLKRTVGGEDGSGRGLYGKPVDIQIRGKVVWSSNFDPDGPGEDNAYWDRQVILPMLTVYVEPGVPANVAGFRIPQNHVAYTELLELRDAFFTVSVNELVAYYQTLQWNPAKQMPASLSSFPLPASVCAYNIEARARQLPLAAFMTEYTRKETFPARFAAVGDVFEAYIIFLENLNEIKVRKDTTQTGFVKLLATALGINVSNGFVEGRGLSKKIVSVKKRQYTEDRSYGAPMGVSAGNDFEYLDRAMGPTVGPHLA